METLTPLQSGKKHRSARSGSALSTLIIALICLYPVFCNANKIDTAAIVILSNISERIADIVSGVSQDRKEINSQFVFDKDLQTCFDNLFSDTTVTLSIGNSIRSIASISANMKEISDEAYVNKILSDELRLDISYFEQKRELMNKNVNLCSNNSVVVRRTRQAITLLDELVAAMRSVQAKITSQH